MTGVTGTEEPDPLIGRTLSGRYRVHSVLGRGGMGTVYQAQQIPLGRAVALKVLGASEVDAGFHQRFFQEAAILAKLKSPHTVTVFDYGRDAGVYFIAMELVSGESLDKVLAKEGPLPLPRVLDIAQQICRSLREAHAQGIVHRDLKPANVVLRRGDDDEELVKVLDFGLAKRVNRGGDDTQRDTVPGSPKYMAPEVIRQEEIDGRSDMYGFGVLVYQMLSGVVPFDRKGAMEILVAHLQETPPPLRKANPAIEVPESVERIVMRCLAKTADARYAHMQELLEALRAAAIDVGLGSNPSWTRPTTMPAGLGREDTGARALLLVDADVGPSGGPRLVEQTSSRLFAVAAAVVIAGAVIAYLTVGTGPQEGHADVVVSPAAASTDDELGETKPGANEPPAPAPAPEVAAAPPVEPAPTPAPIEPSAPVPVPVAPAPGAAEPAPATAIAPVTVNVTSTPSGAVVTAGGKRQGTTPASFVLTGELARPGSALVLRVTKAGYPAETVRRTIDTTSMNVEVVLDPNLNHADLDALRALEQRAQAFSDSVPKPAQVLEIKPANEGSDEEAVDPPAPE